METVVVLHMSSVLLPQPSLRRARQPVAPLQRYSISGRLSTGAELGLVIENGKVLLDLKTIHIYNGAVLATCEMMA